MVNGWKVAAIIFIVLFVLETLLAIWFVKIGTDYITQEDECAYNLCQEHEAFLYSNGVCYCFDNGEKVKETYIG